MYIDIPAFIKLTGEGHFLAAARKIKEQNNLPAICGRVCPQETQCEEVCVRGKKGEPVAIGWLERFIADWAAEHLGPLGWDIGKHVGADHERRVGPPGG